MQPLFVRGPSLASRLILLILTSIALMTIDHRQHHLESIRSGLSVVVYPVRYLVDMPSAAAGWVTDRLSGRQALLEENEDLNRRHLILRAQLQKFAALQAENQRLRELFQSSSKVGMRMLIAELLAADMDPFKQQITLNKGSRHGVVPGQPLLDAGGIMGQVIHVGLFTSTALLITDPSHAIPVQVNRNGLRAIAVGTGSLNRLDVPYIPKTTDLRIGDLLVTSGLGGGFPRNYPVAEIVSIVHNPGEPFASVSAEPKANLERSREVLLVWPEKRIEPPVEAASKQAPQDSTATPRANPPATP